MQHPLQEGAVRLARHELLAAVDAQRSPGLDRCVGVGELPFIGRDLAARMEQAFFEQGQQLLLGQVAVHQVEGDRLEGQVPGREPGVLPGVGHAQHPADPQVAPLRLRAGRMTIWRG